MTKRTIVLHARKDNPILLTTDVIATSDNIYDNHRDIYILDRLTQEHNSNKAVSENIETNDTENTESVS